MLLCRVEPLVHVRANGVSGGEGTEDVAAGVALEAPADLLAGLASPRAPHAHRRAAHPHLNSEEPSMCSRLAYREP
jgi:hypothetical protein